MGSFMLRIEPHLFLSYHHISKLIKMPEDNNKFFREDEEGYVTMKSAGFLKPIMAKLLQTRFAEQAKVIKIMFQALHILCL